MVKQVISEHGNLNNRPHGSMQPQPFQKLVISENESINRTAMVPVSMQFTVKWEVIGSAKAQ